jgi:TonB-dependent SusC/RagA subfamily outer membrane receptor
MLARTRPFVRTAPWAARLPLRLSLAAVVALALAGCAGTRGRSGQATPDRGGATAVSSVTAEDMDRTRVGRIEELLMGRVPGLTVLRRADGDYTLRIRGRVSFMGSDEPLIVIDGMPIQMGASRALATIDPRDVARVDVLKDAGATAAYGSQGGNGVILISTRRR